MQREIYQHGKHFAPGLGRGAMVVQQGAASAKCRHCEQAEHALPALHPDLALWTWLRTCCAACHPPDQAACQSRPRRTQPGTCASSRCATGRLCVQKQLGTALSETCLIRLTRERDEALAALEAAPAAGVRAGANGELANGKRGADDMEEDTEESASAKRVRSGVLRGLQGISGLPLRGARMPVALHGGV